ncbi:MAG: hypothetical protein DWQ01_21095 [Planctomycetota bacterium]|nr:MAG: hypothetical protein DWQ01_21095 [Planctomycetota bacterium]
MSPSCLFALLLCLPQSEVEPEVWWPPAVESALQKAGPQAESWRRELRQAAPEQRGSWTFLLQHMPQDDVLHLNPKWVANNVHWAWQARQEAPWREQIPEIIFLNEILPYAQVNEKREDWRKDFYQRFMPRVKQCQSPGEAAQLLNRELFAELGVRYSTARKKADQSPSESIESGLASCTGLSILLADACRAVGVPARLAGIPQWVNKNGNHTWVEVWDQGWHFLGAAEPDPRGLNHTWFQGDAALAQADQPKHSIYAASYADTGIQFPLVWAPQVDWVHAVNVTARYQNKAAAEEDAWLYVKVLDSENGTRLCSPVQLQRQDGSGELREGYSKGEAFDGNDLLAFRLPRGSRWQVQAIAGNRVTPTLSLEVNFDRHVLELVLPAPSELERALQAYFLASPEERDSWQFSPQLDALLLQKEGEVRRLAWQAYRQAPEHASLRRDFEAKRVRFQKHLSPYTVKEVGSKPASGWPLFIAMHGGGGAPQEVNDSQWKIMQSYYRDQLDLEGGYLYLALRAPNNTWNGFYDNYVYPLIHNLILQFTLFAGVDPDRVFLMGYSHGGYGAFAIGPKMPDHFAAVHSSAAAPTDGESSPKTLGNTPFTYMIGEHDNAYGRLARCKAFDQEIQKLRGQRSDLYPVTMEYKAGHGHTGLPDRDKIRSMYGHRRHAAPKELHWALTDPVIRDFFWLALDQPGKGKEIQASCFDNRIELQVQGVSELALHLDGRFIDFHRPVHLQVNGGDPVHRKLQPSLLTLCRSLQRRGDPGRAGSAIWKIQIDS